MAWKNRDSGDRGHNNGVHFAKNVRTQALETFVKERLTPDLALFLRGQDLFQPDLLQDATATHAEALSVLSTMHAMPVQDAATRAQTYRQEFEGWSSLRTPRPVAKTRRIRCSAARPSAGWRRGRPDRSRNMSRT